MGKLGTIEEMIVKQDPTLLMIWKKNDPILEHAIWHEGNTKEHMGFKVTPRCTEKFFVEKMEIYLGY